MNSGKRVRAVLRGEVPDSVPRSLYDTAIDSYVSAIRDLFMKMTSKHPRDCFRQDLRCVKIRCQNMQDENARQKWIEKLKGVAAHEDVDSAMEGWTGPGTDTALIRDQVRKIQKAGYPVIVLGSVSDFETPLF